MFSMALWMAVVVAPVQALIGDMHGLNTLKYQPVKIAAIEGHWENTPGEPTPLTLVGWPDMEAERTRYALEIPALGSLILTHSTDKQVPALKIIPRGSPQLYRGVLVFPSDGGHGRTDDLHGAGQPVATLPTPPVSFAALYALCAVDGAVRAYRHPCRMGDD